MKEETMNPECTTGVPSVGFLGHRQECTTGILPVALPDHRQDAGGTLQSTLQHTRRKLSPLDETI